MRFPHSSKRRAFSLLEMVLALAIGMMLLAALYLTLSMQFTQAQAGRDVLAEGVLTRSIFTRMANDISGQVAPVDPRMLNSANANNSANPTTPASSSTTPSTTSPATSSATTPSTTSPATTSSNTNSVTFNVGVQGDATNLTISVYRVQPPASDAINNNAASSEVVSDLRVISYWLVNSGSDSGGLARKEFRQATNLDINTRPSSLPDQDKCVIAPEVSSLQFEYFDGSSWQTTWDGTQTESTINDPNGAPPIGPPVAIRITLKLRQQNANGAGAGTNNGPDPTYQHVIALPTANFFNQQSTP